MRNKNLIIYGYNCKNLGDDLMFAEIINKSHYENYYFIGDAVTPSFVEKKIQFIKRGRLLPFRWKFRSDFAVIGGSVLMGKHSAQEKMILQKRNWFLLNKLFLGRNFIVGANLGPFKDKNRYLSILQKLAKYTDKWFVRDQFSFELLKQVSPSTTNLMPDIVMGLNVDKYASDSERQIAISVTSVNKDGKGSIDSKAYESEIKMLATSYAQQGYKIKFVSFEDKQDVPIIKKILQTIDPLMASEMSIVENDDDALLKVYGRSEVIVSTRFHSMVLGALFNKSQIIFSYSDKTQQFADNYGFKVYEVTGDVTNKPPVVTKFSEKDIALVKDYAKRVES